MKINKLRYRIDITEENRYTYKNQVAFEMLKSLDGFRVTNHVYPYDIKIGDFPVNLASFLNYIFVDSNNLLNNYGTSSTGVVGHTEEWLMYVKEQSPIMIFGNELLPNTDQRIFYRPHDDILVDGSFNTSGNPPSSFSIRLIGSDGIVKSYTLTPNGLNTNAWTKSVAIPYLVHYPMDYPLDDLHAWILNNPDKEYIKKYPFFYLDGLYSGKIVLDEEYNLGDVITIMEQDFIVLAKTEREQFLLRC